MDLEFLIFGKEQPKPKTPMAPYVPLVMVYRSVNGGGAWHRRDCSYIKDCTHLEAQAVNRQAPNYARCARCNPPIKTEPYRETGPVVHVYVGLRGTKYHTARCRQLESSIRYDLRDLPPEYERCSSCMPPVRPKPIVE